MFPVMLFLLLRNGNFRCLVVVSMLTIFSLLFLPGGVGGIRLLPVVWGHFRGLRLFGRFDLF